MTDHELRIYHFARYCFAHRTEQAPNIEAGRKWNWEEIFHRRTGQQLSDYVSKRQAVTRPASNG